MMRPLNARVNLDALARNFHVLRQHAPNSKAIAVLKANAYGHGTVHVANALHHADAFAVLTLDEAVLLRESGISKPVILLEGFFSERELPVIHDHHLTAVLHSVEQVDMLEKFAIDQPLPVMVKLNTGMNRLGFKPAQFLSVLYRLEQCRAVSEITLMTHFASADMPDGIHEQLQCFDVMTRGLPYPCCLANSAATLRFPQTHRDMVRLGIAMYGASPFSDQSASHFDLQPSMTLSSEIIGIQSLSAGERVGYGGTFTASRVTRVGVVACGYADGYPRHAGDKTPVVVDGTRTRVLGRVSMDMLCVDLTEIEHARVGMPVELWGKNVSVDEVAQSAGTIGYELLSGLTRRVPLVYAAVTSQPEVAISNTFELYTS